MEQIRAEPTGVFIRDLDFKCFAWNNRCLYNNDQVLAANGYALPLGMQVNTRSSWNGFFKLNQSIWNGFVIG